MANSKDIVRGFYDTAYLQKDIARASQGLDPSFVLHDPSRGGDIKGPEAWKKSQLLYMDAIADYKLTIKKQFSEGDTVATHWVTEGKQAKDLPGIPASGKRFSISGISITRVSGDKIVEEWMVWDTLGFLEQLGAVDIQKIQRVA